MTHHKKATKSAFMNLTTSQIAALNSICKQTLLAQPDLRNWTCPIEVAPGVSLPFLPIRSFRLRNVSRFKSKEHCLAETGAARAFFSSGSTQNVRARHLLSADGLLSYSRSACNGLANVLERFSIPPDTPILSLVPNAEAWPESSLSAMLTFWQDAGYPVHFVDLQNDPAALHKKASALSKLGLQTDSPLIIFGTSLHHLQISQWNEVHNSGRPFIMSQRAWCFDTGGTKGRTQTTTHATLSQKMRQWFSRESRVSILSEYGMCELSSQAYSAHDPHDGQFKCSPDLRAFALSHDLRTLQPIGQPGFLAFIDFANIDSWPCIISEDLGVTTYELDSEFELIGRAPDATLKGCSLNVRDNFHFSLRTNDTHEQVRKVFAPKEEQHPDKPRDALSSEQVLMNLTNELWPQSSLTDLELSLRQPFDSNTLFRLTEAKEFKNKKIAIVASANIPISWLFPALHAWLMGADSVHLYLPAVRTEAPISQLIRKQISDLSEAINSACGIEFIRVHQHRILEAQDQVQYDHVVVFGSDETIAVIRNNLAFQKHKVNFTGLGHFQNSLKGVGLSARTLAEQCLLWFGRGCLTPLAVSTSHCVNSAVNESFAESTFLAMCEIKMQRIAENRDQSIFEFEKFAHQQNLFEVKTLFLEANIHAQIFHNSACGVVVIDLSGSKSLPEHIVNKCFEFAGCGWLNILPEALIKSLPNENPSPGLFDKHQGRTWHDWLTKAETIGEG